MPRKHPPSDGRTSIYRHLKAHYVEQPPSLLEGGAYLPDDAKFMDKTSEIRWAAGALDGVATHHMSAKEQPERIEKTLDLIRACCLNPCGETRDTLYQHLLVGKSVLLIDQVIPRLLDTSGLDGEELYKLAHSLVTEAADREPVKFGLALLGCFREPDHSALFRMMGQHEEFSLFACSALANACEDRDHQLWSLARGLKGWGRVHAVERISNSPAPEIQRWLIREGFRNEVDCSYLAHRCASVGGLADALIAETVDRELLTAAGEILHSLITGGPGPGMDEYADGAATTERFLAQVDSSAGRLEDYLHVRAIHTFMARAEEDWEAFSHNGWTKERRIAMQVLCDRILGRNEWGELTYRGLQSDDEAVFHRAIQAADELGIATWEILWKRLEAKPHDPARWFYALARSDENSIVALIDCFERHFNLSEIANAPAKDPGRGAGLASQRCLNHVLQELRRFPGKGGQLILTALRSPIMRYRSMATAVLEEWSPRSWGDKLRHALEMAASIEPEMNLKKRMEKVLSGELCRPEGV